MAEVLAVASGIAGLLTLTIETYRISKSYVRRVQNASKQVKDLLSELGVLKKVLLDLDDLIAGMGGDTVSFEDLFIRYWNMANSMLILLVPTILTIKQVFRSSGLSLLTLNDVIEECTETVDYLQLKLKERISPSTGKWPFTEETKNLTWPFKEGKTRQTIHSLHHYLCVFQGALQHDTLVVGIETLKEVKDLVDERKDARFNATLEWLSSSRVHEMQRDKFSRHLEGTGRWFLDDVVFSTWRDNVGSPSILWCPGHAGVGKSVMTFAHLAPSLPLPALTLTPSSFVISHLQYRFSGEDTCIAYYYCDYRNEVGQAVETIIASLAKQLADKKSKLPEDLAGLYQKYLDDKSFVPTLEQLLTLFKSLIASFTRSIILIDALDECASEKDRRLIVSSLQSLQTTNVLVTSRVPGCQDIIGTFASPQVMRLDIRGVRSDLEMYIRRELAEHYGKLDFITPDLKEEIISSVADNADGRFLMAALQTKRVCGQRNRGQVKDALNTMPRDLLQMYNSTLERICKLSERDRELGFRVIGWISRAKCPLTVSELQHGLAIDFDDESDRPHKLDSDRFFSARDLVEVCVGLVTVEDESNVIRFVHKTVQEFVSGYRKEGYFEDTQWEMAKACLAYLLFDDFNCNNWNSGRERDRCLEEFSLLRYAATYWHEHAYLAHEKYPLVTLIGRLLDTQKSPAFRNWLRISAPDSPWGRLLSGVLPLEIGAPIYYAAFCGLLRSISSLVGSGADVNERGGDYGNALSAASRNNHSQIVELLLNKGATINTQGGHYGNALQVASCGGYKQVVQLLLDRGADVNAQGGGYFNALQAASFGGHEQVVRLLLEKGANPHMQGGYYGNALQAASCKGHAQIVQLLLDKEANINAHGGHYGNALQAASGGGNEHIVRLLLEKGADPNARGGEFGNALQAASREGHDQIVHLLLDWRADVAAQGGCLGTALQAACFAGHESTAQLLLSKGADANAQGGYYHTALLAASIQGHHHIIRPLLSKGADINVQVGYYGNALQAASHYDRENTTRLLLQNGANVNAQGGFFGDALHAASDRDCVEVVKLLLSKGANVNARGGISGNALQVASFKGYDRIVQLLLDAGADINAGGGRFGNALQAASAGGHEQIVRRLKSTTPIPKWPTS